MLVEWKMVAGRRRTVAVHGGDLAIVELEG